MLRGRVRNWLRLAGAEGAVFLLSTSLALIAWGQPPTAEQPAANGRISDQQPAPSAEIESAPGGPQADAVPPMPTAPPLPAVGPGPGSGLPVPGPLLNQPRSPRSLPSLDQLAMRTRGAPSLRLASVPNMLGDFGMPLVNASVDTNLGQSLVDLPLAAGGLRTKISENNKALPMDRIYFQYHHFHNTFEFSPDSGSSAAGDAWDLDRFTFGLEKTFFDEMWSVDVRMPVAIEHDYSLPGFAVSSGTAGNLNVIFKRLLSANDHSAWATGVGVNLPTGSDARVSTTFDYTIENEAVHLSPFLGLVSQPTGRLFYHAFCELDLPTNGHSVSYMDQAGAVTLGTLTEQTLLQVDGSIGYWLYQNQCAPLLTGLASILELHYTTTLNDGDVVRNGGDQFGNMLNRVDLLNLTVGLHGVLNRRTTFRVGGVVPLSEEPDRAFDAEIQFSLNRYF